MILALFGTVRMLGQPETYKVNVIPILPKETETYLKEEMRLKEKITRLETEGRLMGEIMRRDR